MKGSLRCGAILTFLEELRKTMKNSLEFVGSHSKFMSNWTELQYRSGCRVVVTDTLHGYTAAVHDSRVLPLT